MALTLAETTELLDAYKAAYLAVSHGSSYNMNGRTLTRTDAEVCQQQIASLTRQENALRTQAAGGQAGYSTADFT